MHKRQAVIVALCANVGESSFSANLTRLAFDYEVKIVVDEFSME